MPQPIKSRPGRAVRRRRPYSARMGRATIDVVTAAEAGTLLRRGELVVVPTETVYGIAAAADRADAVASLRELAGSPAGFAWHVARTSVLVHALDAAGHELPPGHQRVLRRLCPGPVTLALELPAATTQSIRERRGIEPGVIEDADALLVRVVASGDARRVIDAVPHPIIAAGIPGGSTARTPDEALGAIDRAGLPRAPAAIVRGEEAPLGRRSTLVRLDAGGGWRVLREGAYESRYIARQLMATLLFVCTGNTCRSPMAAAIARALIKERGLQTQLVARSAGVFAAPGSPATPEAVDAVRTHGGSLAGHESTPLTPQLLEDAEHVFVMTASHLDAVRELAPETMDRVELLDPEGVDIDDPIGQPAAVYERTAEQLRELVARRLDALAPPAAERRG